VGSGGAPHKAPKPSALKGILLGAGDGVHLASKGCGAAALSTALNSNSLNVIAGLLIPGVFIGLARTSAPASVTTWWYVGLTALTLVLAFSSRGLRRWQGGLIVVGYLAFVVLLLGIS